MTRRDDTLEALIDALPQGVSASGYGPWSPVTQDALDRGLVRIEHFHSPCPAGGVLWQAHVTPAGQRALRTYLYEE